MVLSFRTLVPKVNQIETRFTLPTLMLAILLSCSSSQAATPHVHAIVDAQIIPTPSQVIPRGTIVIRDGVIVAVGANVPVPADARIWKSDSLTVYARMIDPCVPIAEVTAVNAAPA